MNRLARRALSAALAGRRVRPVRWAARTVGRRLFWACVPGPLRRAVWAWRIARLRLSRAERLLSRGHLEAPPTKINVA